MFIILLKTVIIYFVIVLVMRLMGKKQAGQLQPYELVITLMIAEVASMPMDSPGTPISYGLVPALTLLLLFLTVSQRQRQEVLTLLSATQQADCTTSRISCASLKR